MIGIINYGVGNLQSVKNSLDFLNISNIIVDKPADIKKCAKLILPGVGAFGPAIEKLNESGFTEKILSFSHQKKPILGLCLGMQLLFDKSLENGAHKGLGLIKGDVLPLNKKVKKLPIPLIGWNNVKKNKESLLINGINKDATFYFVHSFYCKPNSNSAIIATTNYGINFASIVGQNNIFGCQFHPEKSQSAGLQLLKNFNNL